jgi:type I restriction enzyme S subunit
MIGEAEYIRRYCENELEIIPSSWSSVNFEKIIEDKTDSRKKTPKSKFQEEGSIPVVDQGQELIAGYIDDNKKIRIFNKPVIVFGDHTLAFKFIDFDFAQGADGVRVLYPPDGLESKFLYYYFKYLPLPHKGYSRHFKYLKQCQIALPLSNEQERIVQKIESCFEKIDETESSLNKVEKLLEKYRESLLSKAFRGELIPQNPDDEPASVLLSKIRAEREKAETSKKKKVQAFAPITDDEKPFDIPESWEWVRLNEIIDVRDGTHDSPKLIKEGVPLVTSKNLRTGQLDLVNVSYISKKDHEAIKIRSEVQRGDLLMAMIGTIGNPIIVDTSEEFSIKNIALFKRNKYFKSLSILKLFIESPLFLEVVRNSSKGTTQKFLSLTVLRNMLFPLPPMREIEALCKRIDIELFGLKKIIFDIEKMKKHTSLFRDSTLNKAFEGRLVEQIDSEGTGQELLEKILKAKAEEAPKKKVTKKKFAKKTAKKKTTKKK